MIFGDFNYMAHLESRLKAAYYGGFDDNYETIKNILISSESNGEIGNLEEEIWLLWLPHKPLSNNIIQQYGNKRINIEAKW
mgnify:CR=1 FL=1